MHRTLALAAAGVAAALVAGCGGGETLHDVSGTVTYEGKAVAKGLIFFDPASGTPGTQGFANIENGKYDTAAAGQGKGIRGGGKYHVRINGFDGKVAPEAPFGAALFPEHEFTHDFPANTQAFDYDVKKARPR